MTGQDLINYIIENGFEDYEIYITTDGQWFKWDGDYHLGHKKSICLW